MKYIIWYSIFVSYCFAFQRNNIFNHKRLNPNNAIAIFGSTSSLGRRTLEKCLSEYKQVVSLVNSNSNFTDFTDLVSSEQHIIYEGDVTNYNDVTQIYKNHEITGTIVNLKEFTNKNALTKGTTNIIKSMKLYKNTSNRIVITTSIGCGSSITNIPFYVKFLIKSVLKNEFNDKNKQEQLFLSGCGKNLEFCILRHGFVNNDLESSIAIIDKGYDEISREDLASLCYDAITLDTFPYIKKAISVVTMKKKYSLNEKYFPTIHWSDSAKMRLPPK